MYTTNNGATWTSIDTIAHNALSFLSPNVGWSGGITSPTSGGMYKWIGTPTEVEHIVSVPSNFRLEQNYPNPFNPTTEIKFSVAEKGRATLEVFNILGQKVVTLCDDVAEAGQYYKVKFNAVNLASGMYLYKLQSGAKSEVKKLMLIR
jgi:hypothetical protein